MAKNKTRGRGNKPPYTKRADASHTGQSREKYLTLDSDGQLTRQGVIPIPEITRTVLDRLADDQEKHQQKYADKWEALLAGEGPIGDDDLDDLMQEQDSDKDFGRQYMHDTWSDDDDICHDDQKMTVDGLDYDEWTALNVLHSPSDSNSMTTVSGYNRKRVWCNHWQEDTEIIPGINVKASSYFDGPKNGRWQRPDLGIYMAQSWLNDSPMTSGNYHGPKLGGRHAVVYLPWDDYGLPRVGMRQIRLIIEHALALLIEGKTVGIGCIGGHGRTGTVIAALKIAAGISAHDAMLEVWRDYCENAIETKSQEQWLYDFEKCIR